MSDTFDPEAYLSSKTPENSQTSEVPLDPIQRQQFDPNEYLAQKGIESYDTLQDKYGGTGNAILAGLESAGSAATFGLSTGVETALGVSPEGIRSRKEANPVSSGVGSVAGLVSSSFLPGLGEASAVNEAGQAAKAINPINASSILTGAGEGAANALGLGGQGANTLSTIGAMGTKLAVENMMVAGGDEVSKMFAKDPDQTLGTAAANIGLSGVLGGITGVGIGSVNPLWKATAGPKLEIILKGITDKVNGLGSKMPDDLAEAINTSNMEISPEIRAAMSGDPDLTHTFQTLQEGNTKTALGAQSAYNDFREDLSNKTIEALGKDPEELDKLKNLSEYQTGANVKAKISDSIKSEAEPVIDEFNKIRKTFSKVPLTEEHDVLADKLANLAESQYGSFRSGTAYKFVQQVMGDLPNVRDLEGLRQLQSNLWDEAKSGKVDWGTVGKVVGVLRETEGDALLRAAREKGQVEAGSLAKNNSELLKAAGPEAKNLLKEGKEAVLNKYSKAGDDAVMRVQLARSAYGSLADKLDKLNGFLKLKGFKGPDSFVEALNNAGEENILNKLGKENNVGLTNFLKENFSEAANHVNDYHVDSLLRDASRSAKGVESISTTKLFKDIEGMTPEMRSSLFSPEQLEKLNALQKIKESLPDKRLNPSGTAKTLDAIWKYVPSTAIGAATMLVGHNPIMALIVGGLANTVGKDIPDAARLALLKYIGNGGQIEAGAFKSMMEYAQNTIKGETKVTNAVKNVLKPSAEVMSLKSLPTDSDRNRLDKKLKEMQENPQAMMDVGGNLDHYMPDHAAAVPKTAMNAVNYLNSLRPQSTKANPLDAETKPSPQAKAMFDRALNVADAPLSILNHVKEGTLQAQDVINLKNIFPPLYSKLSQRLLQQVTEHTQKGLSIPYNTRMGLSLFLGQPLDSSMTPQGIQSIQSVYAPKQPQQPGQGQPATKKGTAHLDKVSSSYQTPGQAAEQRASGER